MNGPLLMARTAVIESKANMISYASTNTNVGNRGVAIRIPSFLIRKRSPWSSFVMGTAPPNDRTIVISSGQISRSFYSAIFSAVWNNIVPII